MQRLTTEQPLEAAHLADPEPGDIEHGAAARSGLQPVADRAPAAAVLAAGLAVATAVVLCFVSTSELWLDEALSVNIARLPLSQIPEALRHDGSPPLYYLLLHGWMQLFGEGNVAVRALSGVFAVASLPLMWVAARRLGGERAAWAGMLLLASSPFALRYASETRMYSMLVFLSLLGFLVLTRLLERPAPAPAVAVAVVSGLLALTHYWAFYLIAATLLVLGARAVFSPRASRRPAILAIVAVCGGALLFLPWIRSFLFQARYTGTPWARPARLNMVFDSLGEFAGGQTEAGRALLLILLGLAALGLFGRPIDDHRVELDLRTRRPGRGVAAVGVLTLALGLSAGLLMRSAFAARYGAVALAPFLLLAALGARVLIGRRARYAVLGVAMVLGLIGGVASASEPRTDAGIIAASLERLAAPDDIVAYCPDQLGPAVSRLLDDHRRQVTFPSRQGPQFVDWVNYAERQRASNPTEFAEWLDEQAGDGTDVWVVWSPGYRTFRDYCQIIDRDLGDIRPGARVIERWRASRSGEPAWLVRYPATCRRPLASRYQTPAPGCPVRNGLPAQ